MSVKTIRPLNNYCAHAHMMKRSVGTYSMHILGRKKNPNFLAVNDKKIIKMLTP